MTLFLCTCLLSVSSTVHIKFCLYEYYIFFSDWHTVVLNNFLLLLKDGGYSGKKGLLRGSRLQFLAHCFSSKRTNLGEELWGWVLGERPRQSGEAVLRTLAACLGVHSWWARLHSWWRQEYKQETRPEGQSYGYRIGCIQGVLTRGNYSVMLTLGIASSLTGPQPWGSSLCPDLLVGCFASWTPYSFSNLGIRLDTSTLIFCPTLIFIWYWISYHNHHWKWHLKDMMSFKEM